MCTFELQNQRGYMIISYKHSLIPIMRMNSFLVDTEAAERKGSAMKEDRTHSRICREWNIFCLHSQGGLLSMKHADFKHKNLQSC